MFVFPLVSIHIFFSDETPTVMDSFIMDTPLQDFSVFMHVDEFCSKLESNEIAEFSIWILSSLGLS